MRHKTSPWETKRNGYSDDSGYRNLLCFEAGDRVRFGLIDDHPIGAGLDHHGLPRQTEEELSPIHLKRRTPKMYNRIIQAIQAAPVPCPFLYAILVVSILSTSAASAQTTETGTITGQVSNAATRLYLEGATVEIAGADRTATTNREGRYRFRSVPAGERTLRIEYAGLDPQRVTINVEPGEETVHDVSLTSEIYALDEFTVAGEREGNALAVVQQRNAPNVRNVVATDAFGTIVNGNPGDLLQFLPGVAANYVGSEVRSISIRGMDPALSSIMVDGTKLASSQSAGLGREFEFESASLANIESVELSKSLTPDMAADSIGGAVNLRTRSAFDREGRRISATLGATLTPDNDVAPAFSNWGWSGSFSYSDVVGPNENLGIVFSSLYQVNNSTTMSVDARYEFTTEDPAYVYQVVAPRPAPGPRGRSSHALKLEYKLSDRHEIYLGAKYTDFFETSNPHIFSVRAARRVAELDAEGQPTGNGAILPNYTDLTTEARQLSSTRAVSDVRRFPKDGLTYRLNPGGRFRGENVEIDWNLSYSYSETVYDYATVTANLENIGWRVERPSADSSDYRITQTAGPDMYDLANYEIEYSRRDPRTGYDEIGGGQVDMKIDLDLDFPAYVKGGVKYREQGRENQLGERIWDYVGEESPERFLDTAWPATINGIFGDDRRTPPYPDVPRTEAIMRSNPEDFDLDVASSLRELFLNTKDVTERVSSAYVLGDVSLGKFNILGGARLEHTAAEGVGPKTEVTAEEAARREAWAGPVTEEEAVRRTIAEYGQRSSAEGSYSDVFPSLHVRYNLAEDLLLRASWATGIGRPAFGSIIPTTEVDYEDGVVSATNPDLVPQYSDNYDLSLEYYFEPVGLLSIGYFYKEIKNHIFEDTRIIGTGADNGFNGQYAGFTLLTGENGGFAKVQGVEINYLQQFSNAPNWLKYFSVYGNYTKLKTKGDYKSGGGEVQSTDQIAGFIPEFVNAGVSFAWRGIDVRLQWNWVGEHLDVYSSDPSRLRYRVTRDFINLKTKYRFYENYSVYFDILNVFNEPTDVIYQYKPERRFRYRVGSPAYYLGLSAEF
ncbi:MAG: TonB-dependent receptor [Opitutaceae bacterium]